MIFPFEAVNKTSTSYPLDICPRRGHIVAACRPFMPVNLALRRNQMIQLPVTTWKKAVPYQELTELLIRELGLNPIIANVISAREIQDLTQAQRFLSPSLKDLHNPFLMMGMKKGVSRVISAIYNREKILVYGDYDADGITSVAILYDFLKNISVDVSYFIPDRVTDGYGLHQHVIEKAKSQGVSLIVTVDCGSSDYDQILFARSLGIDVVVLDHHEISSPIPEACAVINPKQPGCQFPFKHLAAVGIVFNFLIALRGSLREDGFYSKRQYPNLKNYLDIVALGTIADISPLVDENRIFAKFGLEILSAKNNVGLTALKEVASLDHQSVDSTRASFAIIPRINAAGRIASASEAVELLLTKDVEEARTIARRLDSYNRKRQAMERLILSDILARVEELLSRTRVSSFVFASPDWHPGVIGIVASRLVDRYSRPTILISLKDGLGRGSGRSLSDFNIYEGLKKLDSYLLSYGGHQYAAGISIREDDIKEFAAALDRIVSADMPAGYQAQTRIDSACQLSDITDNLMTQLELLAPFGSSNPEPILCAPAVNISSLSVVGKTHLRLKLTANGLSRNSIWFGKAELCNMPTAGSFDVAFTPQFNHYNGASEVQLKLHDISLYHP